MALIVELVCYRQWKRENTKRQGTLRMSSLMSWTQIKPWRVVGKALLWSNEMWHPSSSNSRRVWSRWRGYLQFVPLPQTRKEVDWSPKQLEVLKLQRQARPYFAALSWTRNQVHGWHFLWFLFHEKSHEMHWEMIWTTMHWTPKETPIYLVMDNAGGHGTKDAIQEHADELKEEHNIVILWQILCLPATNLLDLGIWVSLQSLNWQNFAWKQTRCEGSVKDGQNGLELTHYRQHLLQGAWLMDQSIVTCHCQKWQQHPCWISTRWNWHFSDQAQFCVHLLGGILAHQNHDWSFQKEVGRHFDSFWQDLQKFES